VTPLRAATTPTHKLAIGNRAYSKARLRGCVSAAEGRLGRCCSDFNAGLAKL